MKIFIRSVQFCLYVIIMILFNGYSVAMTMTDEEFTSLTGSEVENVLCIDPQISVNLDDWWEKVDYIKLELNVEKYLKDVLKRVKTERNVSSDKSKYRNIKIKFNGTKCWMSGKYRLTGDLSDHIGSLGEINHSIKIKISNGRVDNILKFKLFAPKSRQGKLEVLSTVLHQKLGLLAPRSALVDVQIGGYTSKAIFQEDINKQFLENNKLHEAILLEGDEAYLPFGIPKVINKTFVSNPQFKKISTDILQEMGHIYQITSKMSTEKDMELPIYIDFFPEDSLEEMVYFHLFNFSLNHLKGLTLDDSRFVFDHISRRYRPIYYDGHAQEKISTLSDINFDIPDRIRLKLLKDLEAIDLIKLKSELNVLGVRFSFNELQKIINNSIKFVVAAKGKIVSQELNEMLRYFDYDEFNEKKALEKIQKANLTSLQVSWLLNSSNLKRCVYRKNNKLCVQETLNDSQKLALQSNPQSLSNGIFLHGSSHKSSKNKYFQELAFNTLPIPESDTIIEHTSNLKLSVDFDRRIITVNSRNNKVTTSQIKVSGGILDGWKFIVNKGVFLGYEKHHGSRASNFGLTGCITFNDISIKSLQIFMHDAMCEDSIHFVRAQGDVDNITIDQSLADAIDADFSDIVFSKLNISNAGNDCADFSAGTYRINNNNFHNCGDKGISAGEGSNVFLSNSEIRDALIGIVVKDGSSVVIQEAKFFNTDVCLAAYKKKQEYGGASMNVKNIYCSTDSYFIQNGSSISYID